MKSKVVEGRLSKNTKKITVSGIMIALATVLSFIKFSNLPFGGSVTLFSFVPIMFVGYAYGAKWGIGAGLVHGILQMMFGISASTASAGFKWWQVCLCGLFDYIVAYSVLGLAGMFKNKIKSPQTSFALGSAVVCLIKYLTHFLSGYILFSGWAEWFFTEGGGVNYGSTILNAYSGNTLSAIYSLIYNGLFSIPELLISTIMVVILISIKPIRKETELR